MKPQLASPISCRLRSVRCAQDLVPPQLGFLLALITAALFASAGSAFAAGPGSAAASPRFAPGRILVAPQPGSADSDFQQALVAHSATYVVANLVAGILAPAPTPTTPTSGYITVSNGHLTRDGQRVKQWGVNLQSGVFTTYAEIDLLVARLGKLGFNAIRLWPTSGTFYRVDSSGSVVPATSIKGDGSDLDRYDYLVAKASEAGMTLQMTMLHYLDLPTLRALKDPLLMDWIQSARSDSELRLLIGFAPYVSTPSLVQRGMSLEPGS